MALMSSKPFPAGTGLQRNCASWIAACCRRSCMRQWQLSSRKSLDWAKRSPSMSSIFTAGSKKITSDTYGYRAQRFRCPLLFPEKTGATCEHEQFTKGKGCVKNVNWELGG